MVKRGVTAPEIYGSNESLGERVEEEGEGGGSLPARHPPAGSLQEDGGHAIGGDEGTPCPSWVQNKLAPIKNPVWNPLKSNNPTSNILCRGLPRPFSCL